MSDAKKLAELLQQERYQEAEATLLQLVDEHPENTEYYNYLAYVASQTHRDVDAVTYTQRAIHLSPENPALWANLSLIYLRMKEWSEAEKAAQESLRFAPEQTEARDFLGQALIGLKRANEAVDCFRAVESKTGEQALLFFRLGSALLISGQYEEAEQKLRRALELRPNHVETTTNLGVALRYLGRYKEALTCYQKAVQINPDHAPARLNRATTWLLFGNYIQGWSEFEYRLLTHEIIKKKFEQPLWDGSPFEGKTILLHAEQGFGDTIQFARYIPLVKARGGHVLIEAQKPLVRWLENHPGLYGIAIQGENRPAFDLQAPLFSLPRIFQTQIETIPPVICPIALEKPEKKNEKLKIGIVWAGRPQHDDDRMRSCKLEYFAQFLSMPNIELHSLQKNANPDELRQHNIHDAVANCHDFLDTAQVIQQLDFVITVDTAVAHLSATLGKPTWILIAIPNDWRWMLEREDSPWYPSALLFRQQKRGNWQEVLERIRSRLIEKLKTVTD